MFELSFIYVPLFSPSLLTVEKELTTFGLCTCCLLDGDGGLGVHFLAILGHFDGKAVFARLVCIVLAYGYGNHLAIPLYLIPFPFIATDTAIGTCYRLLWSPFLLLHQTPIRFATD